MHYDCIDNPYKKCSTCSSYKSAQKKCSRKLGVLTKKSSSKKAKKTSRKKISSTLKQLIEELLFDVPILIARKNLEKANDNGAVPAPNKASFRTEKPGSIFLQLSDKIDNAKTKNENAS